LLVGTFLGWGRALCRWLRIEGASTIAQGALGAVTTATLWGYLAPWWFPDALLGVPWLLAGWLLLAIEWRSAFAARTGGDATATPDSAAPADSIAESRTAHDPEVATFMTSRAAPAASR